jgi:serine phosphatase RsbU (regulator of sigma subunit)
MKNIFQSRKSIQLGSGLLAFFLLLMAFFNFYRHITSPTDENLFTNPPSTISISRPIYFSQTPREHLQSGDLVLAFNHKKVISIEEVQSLMAAVPDDSLILFSLLRPAINRRIEVSLPKKALPDSLLVPLPPYVYVIHVQKDGASDRAGMKVGDLILKINGQTFTNASEADYIMRSGQRDRSIDYDILRSNENITLRVKLAIIGFRISELIMFGCGLLILISGSLLIISRPQYQAARYLGLAGILIGYYLIVIYSLRSIINDLFFALEISILFASLLLGIAFWINSRWYFPLPINRTNKQQQQDKNLFYLVIGLIFLIMTVTLYLQFTRTPINYLVVVGIFHLSIFLVLFYGIFKKIKLLKTAPRHYKEMNSILKKAGITTGVLYFIGIYLVFRQILEPGYLGLLFLIPLASYIYTIGKYSLLDLELRVRRNIQYSIISTFWILALVFLSILILFKISRMSLNLPNIRLSSQSIEVLDEPANGPSNTTIEHLFYILLGSGFLVVTWHVGRAGIQFIGRKYHRLKYDYRLASHEISRMLNTNLDMYSLARELAQKLVLLMRLKRVGVLFFQDQNKCCCQEFSGFDGQEWATYCLNTEAEISQSILPYHSSLDIKRLPENISKNFEKFSFMQVIPIRSKERLVGLILVGEKQSESAFQRDDYEFLGSVAAQSAVSIENAFLYEELREQERLKQELRIARQIQLSSLPQSTPEIPGLDIFSISHPATEVGGDFYDFLNGKNDELLVVVGDVSGKGTSAAIYMAKIQGIFRSLHTFELSPQELFCRANFILLHDLDKSFFVTSLGAKILPPQKKLLLARAGHLPLIHYQNNSKKVEMITSPGLGFGLEDSAIFDQKLKQLSLTYEKNDVFLFITDGITETFNSDNQEFGEERLVQALLESADQSARQIGQYILDQLQNFRGELPSQDDYTLVVVKTE